MSTNPRISRPMRTVLAGLLAVASAVLVLAFSGTHEGHAATEHDSGHGAAVSAQTTHKAAAFRDAMRKLWEDHIAWTRLAIVSFAGDLPDLPATQQRLLRNQTDIGNAIKPFYGVKAGNRLTALLREHITGAVALLQAAKSGDSTAVAQARAAWYGNGRQIARFLNKANPRNWRFKVVNRMMRTHLDQTLQEAVNQLAGRYAAAVRDYDAIHRHILQMADALSSGIVKQFPRRFR
jgi:hypothetical protein